MVVLVIFIILPLIEHAYPAKQYNPAPVKLDGTVN